MIEITKGAINALCKVRAFILDMDGTFYLGEKLFPQAVEFTEFLKANELDFIFLTNNSSKSKQHYYEKLIRLGYPVPQEKIFTSGEATIIYLLHHTKYRKIFLMGTPSLEAEFKEAGFELSRKKPDCAVLGFDTTLTYEKLRIFCDLIKAGIPYIATHPDHVCPVENGQSIPDIGAMMALIETATGRKPDVIIGKPNDIILNILFKKLRRKPHELAFIGDRVYTDIAAGKNAGILTILTLTGETKLKDINDSEIKPDIVVNDLSELIKIIKPCFVR